MGKQHFAQLFVYQFIILKGGKADIFQGKALHLTAVCVPALQRNQGWTQRRDTVPQLFCHCMACTGRTGQRVGHAPGTQGRGGTFNDTILCDHSSDRSILRQNVPGFGMQDLYPRPLAEPGQRSRYVVGVIGHREHTVAPFHLQRQAVAFKKGHGVRRGKPVQRAVKEAAIARDVGHKGPDITVVGHVAAALAGNADFTPQLPVGFQQNGLHPPLSRGIGAHHAGCSAANDYQFSFP